jgi:hypothetical protein
VPPEVPDTAREVLRAAASALDTISEDCPSPAPGGNIAVAMVNDGELDRLPDSELKCLRCDAIMKDAGPMRLHEGAKWGVLGLVGEMMVKRLEVDTYICPTCGKFEFFF